ncbi:uncharacterized protein V6R79_000841 [Siganus canaliculatus]
MGQLRRQCWPRKKINCTQGKIEVGVNVTELTPLSLNASSGNLAAYNCFNHAERDGIVWYEVPTVEGVCGNNLTINDTHAVYSNSLFIYKSSETFSIPVDIPFSCAYPLETDASLDVTLKPFLDMDGKISGTGDKAKAIMKLYKDKSYTATHGPGLVNLAVGSPLYVGVNVEKRDPRFVAVLEDCNATYTSNPADPEGYELIVDQHPVDDKLVSVTQSGKSLEARFTALFFLHVEDYREVYLHCSLSLCDNTSSSCVPVRIARAKRDVSNSELLEPVTIGPIIWGKAPEINDTHAIYSNSLFIYKSSASFSIPVDIPFSCAYPLETDASLDVTLKPFLDMDGKISGTGDKAKAIMKLYKDESYAATHGPGLVNLPVGSPLYVGVTVEGTPSLAAVLKDCNATYTSNPKDPEGYDLIVDQCPRDNKLVSVTQSGKSLEARFTALFFLHVEDYREVYLHCSLRLCSSSCEPVRIPRAKRDVSNSELLEPVTIGPIIWGKAPEV